MSEWKTAPIGEWPIQIIDGDRSSNYPKGDDLVDAGVPFLNTTNIKDGTLDLSDLRFVTEEKAASIRKGRLQAHDIVMTTRGTIGRLARFRCAYPMALINAQMLILRTNPEVLNPDYLFYVLNSEGVQATFRGFASGSAQPQIPIRDLRLVPISLPSLVTQRRIASILRGYDDLIEVNRCRVAVLEEMARGLFEEWFVRFRFPGHEAVPVVDTPDGRLPQGWSWGCFGNLAPEVRETVSPEAVASGTPYIGLEHLSRRSTTLANHGDVDSVNSLKARFHRGDILFGKIRPYFHKVAWAPYNGVCSTDAIVWRPHEAFAAQALTLASSDEFVAHSVQTSNGTKMPRANAGVLAAYKCSMADMETSVRFERLVTPTVEQAACLQATNERLAASRDLLLLRLISGQLSVEAAERELELAA